MELKQCCTCFVVPLRRLKRRYQVVPHITRLAQYSQVPNRGENCLLDPLGCLNRLVRGLKRRYQVVPHITRLAQYSQAPNRGENCFLDPLGCLNRLARGLKRRYQVFPTNKQACTNLTALSHPRKLLSRSPLELKQVCTCFPPYPRRLKRRCQVFPAFKQACTYHTWLPQW